MTLLCLLSYSPCATFVICTMFSTKLISLSYKSCTTLFCSVTSIPAIFNSMHSGMYYEEHDQHCEQTSNEIVCVCVFACVCVCMYKKKEMLRGKEIDFSFKLHRNSCKPQG